MCFKLRPWVSVVCRILLHQAYIGKSCNSQNDGGLFKSSSTQQQKLWRGEFIQSSINRLLLMVETRVSHPYPNTAVYRKHVDRRVYIVTTHFSCRFVIIFDCFNVSNRPQKTHTTTIRASVDYRLTIHVLVYIIGVNFSAREFTTGVLEIKRGRSLQMEKQVTAQQRCTHHTHIPRLFQAPPTYLAFLTQKLSVCILISNVECVWGFSDEWRAPFIAITKEHKTGSFIPSLFDVV